MNHETHERHEQERFFRSLEKVYAKLRIQIPLYPPFRKGDSKIPPLKKGGQGGFERGVEHLS